MNEWIEQEISIKEIENLLKDNIVQVTSPDGWVEIINFVDKGIETAWELKIKNKEILSSNKHFYETNYGWVFAKDLKENYHKILCDDGNYYDFKISKINKKIRIVDITVNHENHRYFSNGVSSHNTGMGKTLTMCSSAVNSLLQNKKVLYLTLEMSEYKIKERIIANLFDEDISNLKKLSKEKFSKLHKSINEKIKHLMIIKEFPAKSLNANKIRNLLKELKTKKSFIPEVIYVDYLGLMTQNDSRYSGNSYEILKIISEELRGIATEINGTIISAVQTNRNGVGAAVIDLTDIADSIGVTATADLIIGITQTDEYKEAGKFCWIVLKNRYGINGMAVNVCVDYPKMRIYGDDEEEKKYSKEKPKPTILVDDAAVDIINNIKKDKRKKINEIMAGAIEM